MQKISLILFIMLLINSVIAQDELTVRNKILPLLSDKSEVEKLTKFVKNFQDYIR